MAWAAKCTMTRAEDEAYCLLGLFSINMPTLYREGRQAFQQLQTELIKRSIDPALCTFLPADAYFGSSSAFSVLAVP